MGKRRRDNERRMHKRPKPDSESPPVGGGGTSSTGRGRAGTTTPHSSEPPPVGGGGTSSTGRGPAGTTTPQTPRGQPLLIGSFLLGDDSLPPSQARRVTRSSSGTPSPALPVPSPSSGGGGPTVTGPPGYRPALAPSQAQNQGRVTRSSSGTPSPALPVGNPQMPPVPRPSPSSGGGPQIRSDSRSPSPGLPPAAAAPTTWPTTWPPEPPIFLIPTVNAPDPQLQSERRLWEAERLLLYMESKCKEAADSLWESGKWHLHVDFSDLKAFNKDLAYKICNNESGNAVNNGTGGKEYYASAMRTFLFEHFEKKSLDGKFDSVDELKSHIEEHGNLTFARMPKSIMRFSDYKPKSKIVKLFAGQKYGLDAVVSTDPARLFLCKMFKHMLDNHKKGVCWDGNWTADDWELINGEHVNLLATPMTRTGRDHSDKDLNQFANSVLPTFELNGVLPAFMEHLKEELLTLPEKLGDTKFPKNGISDKDFFDWYYTYIQYHPAMMSSLARSTLLEGLYFCMDKLDYKKLKYYKDIAGKKWHLDWRADFLPPPNIHQVLWSVFWYNRIPGQDPTPHDDTYPGLLGYHRHLVQHSPDNGRTQWVALLKAFVQSMKNSDESELMAAHHDENILPEFIKNLFLFNFMKQPEFAKRFNQYKDAWGK